MISGTSIVRFFVGIFIIVTTTKTTTTTWTVSALSSNNAPSTFERRSFFRVVATSTASVTASGTIASSSSQPSFALDMDAFVNQELSKEKEKSLMQQQNQNDDDARMCRYGAPGQETGDACTRAGLPTARKSGVDAYGNIDRGDYIRCTTSYKIENDRYMKIVTCQDKNRSYIKEKCVAKGAGCV